MTPTRVQLRRTKGWRMPDNTIKCDRTTRWGNHYRVVQRGDVWVVNSSPDLDPGYDVGYYESDEHDYQWIVPTYPTKKAAILAAVENHRRAVERASGYVKGVIRAELAGKNLACWCPLDAPCHADVLLEIANSDTVGGVT